jgi:hypothetical protein
MLPTVNALCNSIHTSITVGKCWSRRKEKKIKGEEMDGKEKINKILPIKKALDLRLYIYFPLSFFV